MYKLPITLNIHSAYLAHDDGSINGQSEVSEWPCLVCWWPPAPISLVKCNSHSHSHQRPCNGTFLCTCKHPITVNIHSAYLTHDDGAINSQSEVSESDPDQADDPLHPVYLLAQEDVHRWQRSHLLETSFHLMEEYSWSDNYCLGHTRND